MATTRAKSLFLKLRWRPFQRLLSFFQRLQWKLTLAYTLSIVLTVLILGVIGLGLMWYLYFWSDWVPHLIADGLLKTGPLVSPYLEQTPPDRAGLNNWLSKVMVGDNLVINIPPDEKDSTRRLPAQFGQVVLLAIVNPQGQMLAGYPAQKITAGTALAGQLSAEAVPGFEAALQGETEPALLSTRNAARHMVATAPVFGANKQLLGAIFLEATFPIEEGEFLRGMLQQTILPVAGAMLLVGLIAALFFGYFIARGLTRRLRVLDKVADEWSRGNFEALARDASGDEVGQLARQLNYMAMQLQNLLQTRQELATLEERHRLARDLHDSVKQQVFATAMQVGAARALLPEQPADAQTHLLEAERLVHEAQQELTTLIRELRPAALEGKGLAAALRDYVADWSRQNQISAEVRVQGERPLPLVIEQTLFRVAQEALANVSRHSAATTTDVHLVCAAQQVTLTISDNGHGFQVGASNGKGLGLRNMRERVESLGGNFTIESEPTQGTRIAAHLTTA